MSSRHRGFGLLNCLTAPWILSPSNILACLSPLSNFWLIISIPLLLRWATGLFRGGKDTIHPQAKCAPLMLFSPLSRCSWWVSIGSGKVFMLVWISTVVPSIGTRQKTRRSTCSLAGNLCVDLNPRVVWVLLILLWWTNVLSLSSGGGFLLLNLTPSSLRPLEPNISSIAARCSRLLLEIDDFRAHVKFLVGNGSSARFWLDWWMGDDPVSVRFSAVFYFSNPHISILGLAENNWDMGLRRTLSREELGQW